jgi:hypothetical protein
MGTIFMTQTLNDLSTRINYDLTYFYSVKGGNQQTQLCTLSVAMDGKVVDTFTPLQIFRSSSRTVPLPLFASNLSVLVLSLVCPRITTDNYVLDAITITRTN